MLFDLRSRGRRRTVQAVYLGLAVLMGGGLVLFGVGAGNGLGGLLNAFTGKGSSNNQSSVVSQAEKNAIKATQINPNNAAAWANLIQARWSQARSSSADVNANTGQFTAAGNKELTALGQDWLRYKKLVKQPDRQRRHPRRPRLPVPRQLLRRHHRVGRHHRRQPHSGDRLRMPRRQRLRGQPDPHRRPGLCQGPQPGAQGPAHPAPVQDRPGEDQPRGRAVLLIGLRAARLDPGTTGNIAGEGPLAQLVEQGTLNPKVGGSSPPRPTAKAPEIRVFSLPGSPSNRAWSTARSTRRAAVSAGAPRTPPSGSCAERAQPIWSHAARHELLSSAETPASDRALGSGPEKLSIDPRPKGALDARALARGSGRASCAPGAARSTAPRVSRRPRLGFGRGQTCPKRLQACRGVPIELPAPSAVPAPAPRRRERRGGDRRRRARGDRRWRRRTAVAGLLALVMAGVVVDARRWVRLAARSRVGAQSEAPVRRALSGLEAEGWQLRHSLPYRGRGDIDSVAIAPTGVAFAIESQVAHIRRTPPGARPPDGRVALPASAALVP